MERPKAWGGLGCVLVLVKLLVELHGWGVNVYSSEGMGVCSLIHGGHKKVLSYFIQPFYEKEEESTAFLKAKVRFASLILATSPPLPAPRFSLLHPIPLSSCTLARPLLSRSLGRKKRERYACARAKHGEAQTPRILCSPPFLPPFSSLLLSLLLSCPGARVPHRHRRRTTRALPPMLRRKLQGISPPPSPPCVRPAPRFSRVQLF